MTLTPLNLSIEGQWVPINDPNRRWKGSVRSSEPFAALLLARTPKRLLWAKAEIAAALSLILDVHPLREEGNQAQLIMFLGDGFIADVIATLPSRESIPVVSIPNDIQAGVVQSIACIESEPKIEFHLLFLARADVRRGRTGIWRPHKSITNSLPADLLPYLEAGRNGAVDLSLMER